MERNKRNIERICMYKKLGKQNRTEGRIMDQANDMAGKAKVEQNRRKDSWRLGAWNFRGTRGKEKILGEEFEKRN